MISSSDSPTTPGQPQPALDRRGDDERHRLDECGSVVRFKREPACNPTRKAGSGFPTPRKLTARFYRLRLELVGD
jgi:hypothetical protein